MSEAAAKPEDYTARLERVLTNEDRVATLLVDALRRRTDLQRLADGVLSMLQAAGEIAAEGLGSVAKELGPAVAKGLAQALLEDALERAGLRRAS